MLLPIIVLGKEVYKADLETFESSARAVTDRVFGSVPMILV